MSDPNEPDVDTSDSSTFGRKNLYVRQVESNKNSETDDNKDIEEFDTDEEDEKKDEENTVQNLDSSNDFSKHLTYEGDLCIYNVPGTNKQMIWDVKNNVWIPRQSKSITSTSNEAMKNYEFDGENYIYTNKVNNITYKFDQQKNEWVVKDTSEDKIADNVKISAVQGETSSGPTVINQDDIYGFENDTHTYRDPSDGTIFFWDREKKAWFPKIDDDFIAMYQMRYGCYIDPNPVDDSKIKTKTKADIKKEKEQKKVGEKKKEDESTWFEIEEAHNTAIYISGLPLDITTDELTEMVTKYGVLARDDKNKAKLKLYLDADGQPKGDALCKYIKVESVENALEVLDGFQLRGKTISIERAKFQMKGQYDPTLKPKRKKNFKERQKKFNEKQLDWRSEPYPGIPLKNERVVIIKNLFTPEDFDKDVQLLLEYQQDIRSECIKCGEVKKVTLYDRHPEGIAQVTFREPAEAQTCIQLLNGRWFGKRKITAEIWDGKTKYKINETDAELEKRFNNWDKYLDNTDDQKTEKTEKSIENVTK